MSDISLIIQSTRLVHKDFTHLIKTMESCFDNIYFLHIDDSHPNKIFKNIKKVNYINVERNNMSDRFDKFLSLWREISNLSQNINSKQTIVIRADLYINPIEFFKIIENKSSLLILSNYSIPYIPFIGRYFPDGHFFDGFIKCDKELTKNIYNEIENTISATKKSFFNFKINIPKVSYLNKCPEYYLIKSLKKMCNENIVRIGVKNCEWSIKKWGILDFIFRRPFFRTKNTNKT